MLNLLRYYIPDLKHFWFDSIPTTCVDIIYLAFVGYSVGIPFYS